MIKWIKTNVGVIDNLGEQCEKVFKHCRAGSLATRRRYFATIRRFLSYTGEVYKLQKIQNISNKHLEAYITTLKAEGKSDKYLKTEASAIRYFIEMIPNSKHQLEDAKQQNFKLGLASTPDGRVDRQWSYEELNEFVKYSKEDGNKQISQLLQICYSFGLRLEEAVTLRRHQAEQAIKDGILNLSNTKGGHPRKIKIDNYGKKLLSKIIMDIKRGDYILMPEKYKVKFIYIKIMYKNIYTITAVKYNLIIE